MVTSRTDDKSRTSESNLAGENECAKIESSFYYMYARTVNGEATFPLSFSLSFLSSFFPARIIYASISNLRETVRKITGTYSKANRIEKQ